MAFPSSPEADHVEKIGHDYMNDLQEMEDGSYKSYLRNANPRRSWRVSWEALDATDLGILTTYYDGQKGSHSTDSWTNPEDSGSYTVRIKSQKISRGLAWGYYNLEWVLEEDI